jgi:hypothetical protein
MSEVVATDVFTDWYRRLDDQDTEAVIRVVDLLEARGVALGHPYSSSIQGSRMRLRELRVQSGGKPIRILYAFDPKRNAVLLIGGAKTGDDRFYEKYVPAAEKLFRDYLQGS